MINSYILTCPHCKNKEDIEFDSRLSKLFHRCIYCQKSYGVSKNDCCLFCSFANLPCKLVDQNLAL